VDVVEDGFNLLSDWKANLGWNMELPGIERSNLTLEVSKTWVNDSMCRTDENLGLVQGRGTEASDYESRQDGVGESRRRAQVGVRFEF
jgi:hypothetical protein